MEIYQLNNIFEFVVTEDKVWLQVFVYPNITYLKDLEKDHVIVLSNILKKLYDLRKDLLTIISKIHW